MKRDKILIIISDRTLRQLYHELFVHEELEVTMAESIGEALVLLTLHKYSSIILYEDDEIETKTFLRLKHRRRQWFQIPLLILTPEPNVFATSVTKKDILFNSLYIHPSEIVEIIKTLLI
ncbi:MAG: hypothetical protein UV61_C0001G0101 [Candidatus Gottesmanbacteria bacterium GW2011_GWB1_43_11]|uniref:Response regulatory domain-containing protein n=1 Tax=Candidatus Gottesmanbacteria bacterium GW2011_GWB1_43_11 TaxID=1618446 RepID=A0A0G1CQ80_9BACT|nr:MAG: hypothetical protein UV04_C0004G0043 [Candidatus Gottesmanbacteria bacterium GW2011_GWA2_42_16]KKS56066.1 MAG: hypothetical protein UV17_C0003G0038 [Candidatus Gottesmanbacteria bacterium GW2011_GWA1_42_26]KKS81623.1 MAG: hypothetical protein UV55_C0011G0017 [Candidatus Gottesmanbacteria bacterium GW2011_GWC1_43_10]KKS87694.1 MAG: hypothetical protein UV61_C0001G0101 [Candidatus Gottesmanbacteria bacterium GW2011_GWB1_43_11]OGG07508.1 MAG: hypothetical protein A2699_00480 [Candidatus Go